MAKSYYNNQDDDELEFEDAEEEEQQDLHSLHQDDHSSFMHSYFKTSIKGG